MALRKKRLDEAPIGSYNDSYLERHFTQGQETEWELVIIGECKEALKKLNPEEVSK